MGTNSETTFFTHEKSFYKKMFQMMIIVALQNLVAYSVNMVDNMMLGSYSQEALSGAATVNQVFFMVQQFALSVANALVVLASQYWGQKNEGAIQKLTGIAMKLAAAIGLVLLLVCRIFPRQILLIFTKSDAIVNQGMSYLDLVSWTFFLFMITNVLMAALRSVGIVKISFYISVVSLFVNCGINYVLIFGKFGAPEMGVRGAGVGTLVSRIIELGIVVGYMMFADTKIKFFVKNTWKPDAALRKDYAKVYGPIFCSQVLWGISVPMQTAILGRLSDNAIAANSVATTFYQYLKVIVIAMSSTASVLIGNAIGEGKIEKVKQYGRTIAVVCVAVGVVLGALLIVLRYPLLSMYNLNEDATQMALNLIVIMAFIMVGMSYQMPVSFGIIQGGGDAKFTMYMNLISTWLIVMPLSFMAAFWWKLPVEWVVVFVQSDQVFKGIPVFIHFRKYKWMKKLTRA